MGCNQSKIEDEEAVARCKERKQYMRAAVAARNAFAAGHSSYGVALRNTGAALSDYASSESLIPHLGHSVSAPASSSPLRPEPPSFSNLPPPPPPIPVEMAVPPPAPLQRAQTMPEIVVSKGITDRSETIVEEEEEEEVGSEVHSLKRRSRAVEGEDGIRRPPTPPPLTTISDRAPPPPMPGGSTWDFFFNVDDMPGGNLGFPEELSREREETERKVLEEMPKRAELDASASVSRKIMEDLPPKSPEKAPEKPPSPLQEVGGASGGGKLVRRAKPAVAAPGVGGGGEEKRTRKSVSLIQIFSDLDDLFLRASESAHEVSKMLETARLHYHSSFANNCGHINHSERVMRVITWNRSFRGLPNNDARKDELDFEENETHATVLDKLLAWEKKLYDEVKAGELMKFEYQRKVAMLNRQKKRGASIETLEKTKASVSHLHTRYIVDMQSLDSTVSEISRLRDEQLYPKLVELVDGMAIMWHDMQSYHQKQLMIVSALRNVDISQCVKETSEQHSNVTEQLWLVVQEWHNQFDRMISYQKRYIKDLNSWLKLNLVPIESSMKEKVSSPPRPQNPPIRRLLLAWHDFLEKLPEELAKSAIYNFAAVLHTIVQHQDDELKTRARCDEARKDLSRKTRAFEDWYHRHMQRRTPPDEVDPDRPEDFARDEAVMDREVVVEAAKRRVEEEEALYQRRCLQVREKSLTSLRTRLPELFRSLSDFAVACSEMYRELRSISRSEMH